ncbi:MAG TPA: TetR/AcrR family transcriptional regulator [Pseudonocardia sp.]|jgi:AcrR family transcriptional regulator
MPRQRLSVDHRREHLLRVGLELLSTREDTPAVAEIARAAGVSKGLLYHYFPDKEDFLSAVLRRAAGEMREATATTPGRSMADQVGEAVDGFLGYAEAHSAGYRLIFGHRYFSERLIRLLDELRAERVELVVDYIAGLAPPEVAGRVRGSAVLRTALEGALSFTETAVLRWLEHRDLSREQLRALLVGAMVGALSSAVEIDSLLCGELAGSANRDHLGGAG